MQQTTTKESYTYDPVGNRLSSLGVAPYSYNSSNELTDYPGVGFGYDNNGNTLSKTDAAGTTQYTWDFENRLTQVTLPGAGGTVTFKYDPFGRRVQKAVIQGANTTTTNYVYDGANMIEEVDDVGTVQARYTQGLGIDEPLAMLRGGVTSYYHADGLGSITSLSNAAGALANTYAYDSFGKLTASTGTLVNPFRYTGREFDSETDEFFYRARYYDQNVGRFLSEDPIGFDGGGNFYAYVLNGPTNFRDPNGHEATAIAIGGGILAGGEAATAIAAGAAAGGAVVGAGAVGWGIGRGIGHIPIGAGHTVDDAVTDVLTDVVEWVRKKPDKCKKGKWHCIASCHINNFSNLPNMPSFVTGEGWGNSIGEAQIAAEKDANTKVPRGTYKRHCRFKCEQR